MNLISEEYRAMQSELHRNPSYGVSSVIFAPIVDTIIEEYDVKDLLDYGAGKCRLYESIENDVKYTPYEPSNELWAKTPMPTEMVACIDVLEHIEPELIDNVLDDLKRLVLKVGFFTIHTGAAMKLLPDGRNAHLIQEPYDWWKFKLEQRFDIIRHAVISNGVMVLVRPKDS